MVRKKGAYRRHAERDPLQHHGSGVLRGPRRRLLIVRRRILLRLREHRLDVLHAGRLLAEQ